jgi:hypothetical protein
MALNSEGVTPKGNWITEVWPDELSDATQAEVVLSELVDRSFQGVMSHGDVITIPNRSNLAVRVKTEDAAITYSNINESQQQITVNRQAYSAFFVEDIADLQSSWDIRQQYTDGYSLVAFIEGDVTSGLASLPDDFSQLVGTLGTDPTDDDWLRAVQYLDDGDVPRSDRFIYVSPATHISLLKNEKFFRQETVGQQKAQQAILDALVGRAYGADVYVSSLANNNPSSANTSYSWFCQKRGVALIEQRKPMVHVDYDINNLGTAVAIDVIFQHAERLITPSTLGGGTANDRFCCGIRGA